MPSHDAPHQPVSNGIIVPEAVVKCGLVEPEGRLFWAVDTLNDAVFVSRYPDRFLSNDRFTFVGESTVGGQRFTRPPKQLYPDCADEVDLHVPVLDAEKGVRFEITEWLLERDICRVVPVE